MYELRYYYTNKDLIEQNNNYDLVGRYNAQALAFGMRKKKAKEPQYKLHLLKVVNV